MITESIELDTVNNKSLLFNTEAIAFIKNNEYKSDIQLGYTLPGFWIRPRLIYQPISRVKIELGAHLTRFWGTDVYPSYSYSDIADWKGEDFQKGFHALPFLRIHGQINPNLHVIMGNLYGGAYHNLIAPIYHSELNLSADPEMGLQVIYNRPRFGFDVWVNWESFIFQHDSHFEVFTAGLSSQIDYTSKESQIHLYTPIQGILQHRGGELDDIITPNYSVQTYINASVGFGAKWNPHVPACDYISAEVYGVGYSQQAGTIWPTNNAIGLYAKMAAKMKQFYVEASYWDASDYISILGNPYYGVVAINGKYQGEQIVDKSQMLYLGAEYTYAFHSDYKIGVEANLYHHLTMKHTGISIGVYFRVNPSFLLLKK